MSILLDYIFFSYKRVNGNSSYFPNDAYMPRKSLFFTERPTAITPGHDEFTHSGFMALYSRFILRAEREKLMSDVYAEHIILLIHHICPLHGHTTFLSKT